MPAQPLEDLIAGGVVATQADVDAAYGRLLAAAKYSSGSDAIWKTTSSATSADIDATNAKLDIVVPASGRVLVVIDVFFQNTVTAGHFWLDVRVGSTVVGSALVMGSSANLQYPTNYAAKGPALILLEGLTPGPLTIKAGFRISAGTANLYCNDGAGVAGGHVHSPFLMLAWAA